MAQGLGLPYVRNWRRRCEGTLTVVSAPGKGSTFSFTLPLPPVAPSDRRAVRIDATMILPENFPRLRILIVDDVTENIEVVKVYLKNYPVQLDTAENGEEALSLINLASYDVILMDVRMPVMDGITATKRIRERERLEGGRHETIIAITAHAFQEQKSKFLDDGFDGVLTKPFFKRELVQTLYRFASKEKVIPPPDKMGNKALGFCLENQNPEKIPDSLRELLPDLFNTIRKDFETIQASLQENELETVYTTVHSLKGVAGMFGFHHLSSLITDFSHSVKSRNFVTAGELLTTLQTYIEEIERQLVDENRPN